MRIIKEGEFLARVRQGISLGDCWVKTKNGIYPSFNKDITFEVKINYFESSIVHMNVCACSIFTSNNNSFNFMAPTSMIKEETDSATVPAGGDPIYAKNFWGKIEKIGEDGERGNDSYLVKGEVAKKVKAATKAGNLYTDDLSESKNVMHIPTGEKLEGVKKSFDDTLSSQREYGGHSNYGDTSVTHWDEGEAAIAFTDQFGNKGAMASLTMFIVNGVNIMPDNAANLEMWWHVHPKTTVNGIKLGNSNPSDADFDAQKLMIEKGYKGNTFVIGTRDEKVTFFNKDGVLITVKWSDFLRMGGQK